MAPGFSKDKIFQFLNGQCKEAEAELIQQWLSDPANIEITDVILNEYWNSYTSTKEDSQHQNLPALFVNIARKAGIDTPDLQIKRTPVFSIRRIAMAVTAIASCIIIIFAINSLLNNEIAIKTAYGETKKITLPDGSVVTLNSNSSLKYAADWDLNKDREIYLDGEAFFSVKHLPGSQKFKVITDGSFNVEVLGTQFSVYNRKHDAYVVLNSGKVKVDFKDESLQDVIMKPGELVRASSKVLNIIQKPVDTAQYNSWKDGRLVFNETSMNELSRIISESYGLELVLKDSSLKDMKINGVIPANNRELLVNALEAVLQVKIQIIENRLEMNTLKKE